MVNYALAASDTSAGDKSNDTRTILGDVECPCPHRKCKFHSKCDLCIAHHEAHKKYKPYCQRDKYLKKMKK